MKQTSIPRKYRNSWKKLFWEEWFLLLNSRISLIGLQSRRCDPSIYTFARPIHVTQYHKLMGEVAVQESKGNISRERAIVDNIVISTVAMKTVMA